MPDDIDAAVEWFDKLKAGIDRRRSDVSPPLDKCPPVLRGPEDVWHESRCPSCDNVCLTAVRQIDLDRWRDGEHIQTVWPQWSNDKRERLMTGYCPTCFDRLFAEPDDDYELGHCPD